MDNTIAEAILDWYQSLTARRVDLISDYAGNELFIIDLDSLLLHCFSDAKIDFSDGFQLLHAVYVVEKLLQHLASRKCNFHIVNFDDNERLCIPPTAKPQHHTRYMLARAVIVRSLQRNLDLHPHISVRRFKNFTDASFLRFLESACVYFVLCHDGAHVAPKRPVNIGDSWHKDTPERASQVISYHGGAKIDVAKTKRASNSDPVQQEQRIQLRTMIAWFINHKYSVALINELHFVDTKAFAIVLEYSHSNLAINLPPMVDRRTDIASHPISPGWIEHFERIDGISERDVVTILALCEAINADQISNDEAASIILHAATLQFLPLANRRFVKRENETNVVQLNTFVHFAAPLLKDTAFLSRLDRLNFECDLSDLLDGLLLTAIQHNKQLPRALLNNTKLKEKYELLSTELSKLCGSPIVYNKYSSGSTSLGEKVKNELRNDIRGVLPFKHAVFDKHLRPINVQVEAESPVSINSKQAKIFMELSHWHNHKKSMIFKGPPPRKEWFARRRDQWFMAEMQSYAASLTNSSGKTLEPETIIVGQRKEQKRRVSGREGDKSAQTKKKGKEPRLADKESKHQLQVTKKGGKAAALEAAAVVQAKKSLSKAGADANFWRTTCERILSREDDPKIRYMLAKAHLQSMRKTDSVSSEVVLFMLDCLLRIVTEFSCVESLRSKMSLAALMWDAYHRLSKTEVEVTSKVNEALQTMAKTLELPAVRFNVSSNDRPLAFHTMMHKQLEPQRNGNTPAKVLMGVPITIDTDSQRAEGLKQFQLEYCGPYMDRAIDSAPDPRVPFEPDAWQRKVLDAIDERKSLFVVAPTSAGKTFISFYAIKKILEASDDDVVLYVAPTKALVNQIAAEIEARFSKTFKYPGRSVWGIHTRDYRINNPTGCQVLVTVPHILQIMLLAPVNAEKSSSWSNKIKIIIFDEVHCIGQADDGVVWEQLLLQAPCPIIALSATIGNPTEFSEWLGSTQQANGNELVTIQHKHRYSDLRKFVYTPPQSFCFSGLPDLPLISIPGLDGTDAFAFVHPISSLINKSRGMPDDLSLEARDCLRLWQYMVEYQTETHQLPSSLHPDNALPDVIKKADVLKWESKLKQILLRWTADENSPFQKVRQALSYDLERTHDRPLLSAFGHTCNEDCKSRTVIANELMSTVLPVLVDLHSQDALPGIVFNYDRRACERLAQGVVAELEQCESRWKEHSHDWKRKAEEFEKWSKAQQLIKTSSAKKSIKKKAKRTDDNAEGRALKEDRDHDSQNEASKWESFDPTLPLDRFSFADTRKVPISELHEYQKELRDRGVSAKLVDALQRGIGVHHAGMNRKYRFVVEILFRKGFLRVVIATGTLALGINMPCKTVLFAGDSVYLTALNFRQAAGRAGRRGFDQLGNVVFLGTALAKVYRLLSSRLPDINGHFPVTTSLVLRLATLSHQSQGSGFAPSMINSILSQPRLYLGSPESKMAVLHHVRFSIEYLRRQSLLSADGVPLNFAECVSHLYYTENAAWSFHALLSAGYFHDVCKNVKESPGEVCRTLIHVLSHIFGRVPCKRSDEEFSEEIVKGSPSIVFLPELPQDAAEIMSSHNEETLKMLHSYVQTYVNQHLCEPDNTLPFTGTCIGSNEAFNMPVDICLPPSVVRSPFVSLSGPGDRFESISDLCTTVRSGVFLEEAVIPYLPMYPGNMSSPLNAYLYDFYKHGSIKALEKGNKIRSSDVWFHLNDFSLVLATIVTSLSNHMKVSSVDDFTDEIVGSGDSHEAEEDSAFIQQQEYVDGPREGEEVKEAGFIARNDDDLVDHRDEGLPNLLLAFELLQKEFNAKFKKTWS